MSLTVSRHKVLIQDGTGKDLSFDAKLQVNNGFTSDKIKVQVSLIKKEEKAAETTTLAEAPVERKHVIDAAIVRIMKSRNRLEHNALLEEVFRQCTLFKPQPTQIKSQIESRQVELFNLFWSYLKLVSLLVTTFTFLHLLIARITKEHLIEREFLKRDEKNRNAYIYLPWWLPLEFNRRGADFSSRLSSIVASCSGWKKRVCNVRASEPWNAKVETIDAQMKYMTYLWHFPYHLPYICENSRACTTAFILAFIYDYCKGSSVRIRNCQDVLDLFSALALKVREAAKDMKKKLALGQFRQLSIILYS